MRHLESCVRTAISRRKSRKEYDEQYPMHCEICEGWGGSLTLTDPALSTQSDIGSNLANINDCPDCVQKGVCPRCSSPYDFDEDSPDNDPCDFCGFELGETEGKVYPHVCICDTIEENN